MFGVLTRWSSLSAPLARKITTKIRGFRGKTYTQAMLIYLLPATGSVSYFRLRAAQFVLHFTSLLLCRRSSLGEQQRAYLMSAALLWFAQSLTFFFIFLPKQWNICCQLLHIPGYHGCQAPPPPLCAMYGIYDPHWDRGHRSGRRKCSSSLLWCCQSGGSFFT